MKYFSFTGFVVLFLISSGSVIAQESKGTRESEAVPETKVVRESENTQELKKEISAELSNDTHTAIQTFEDEDLTSVVAVDGTKDGKFLYTAAFVGKAVCSFEIDPETGTLGNKKVQSVIPGAVGLAVSPDQKWVAVCAHRIQSVVLFSRDAETGDLEFADSYQVESEGPNGAGYPIAITFSPNSKFVYVSDGSGAVHCFECGDDSLKFLASEVGEDDCLFGARNLTFDTSGKHLMVVSITANSLTIFDHNPENGSLTFNGYAGEDEGDVTTLEGAHGVTFCPDSKHAYVTGARYTGDDAVTTFEIGDDGKWKLLQALENEDQLEDFLGGNLIKTSPDGKFVYASGARSSNLACFKRDAASGKLTFDQYFNVDDDEDLEMTSGIFASGDNRFVYVGGERAGCMYVFERKPKE